MKDWKFWVMLIATVAAVFVPIWIWRADISSKALAVRSVSEVNLQPYTSKTLEGIEVSLSGKKIESPHLTVLEIENTGAKAITSADWETPLTLQSREDAKVIRAELGETSVPSLKPALDFSAGAITVKPLLLNPGDRFSIVILTSGRFSEFAPNVRIAGIADVEVEKRSRARVRPVVTWVMLLFGCLGAGLLLISVRGILGKEGVTLSRVPSVIALLVSAAVMTAYIVAPLKQYQLSGFAYFISYLVVCVIGGAVGAWAIGLGKKRIS